MTITKALKARLVEKHGLPADADDASAQTLVMKEIMAERISPKELTELTSENPDKNPVIDRIAEMIGKSVDAAIEKRMSAFQQTAAPQAAPVVQDDSGNPTTEQMFKGATAQGMTHNGEIKVKKASERYSSTKSAAKWQQPDRKTLTGKSVTPEDREQGRDAFFMEVPENTNMPVKRFLDMPSQAEYAKMGAVFKHMAYRSIGQELYRHCPFLRMTEEDHELVKEAAHEDNWVGPVTKNTEIISGRKLRDFETKAVLEAGSDASGGEQAVPQYFDYDAIRTPLLFGELAPWVSVTPTNQGRAAHSYSIGTPTFVATGEGTAITPFDTTSFVATYDVPFFPASCGFEWGRDFEMDSAPQFGALVMAQMGDSFKNKIDFWIANGDGTTQPQGLGSASGGTTVAATSTSHAVMVYNDALNLQFGMTKPFRNAFGGGATRMIMNDSQYKRLMQIVTGVTGDTRPIFGMHVKDYLIGDYGVSIENNIINGTMYLCNLRGYRLYQRKGITFDLVTDGRTLTLSQTKLLFARARFGGKISLGGYYAKMINAGLP